MTSTTTTLSTESTLARLLDEELAFSATFNGRYSNHLPMALVALDQLGAPTAALEVTFDAYAQGASEPRADRAALDERIAEIERDGIDATLARCIPPLSRGPGTRLFHPLIRLGYGLDAEHDGQVAAALLDWEEHLLDLSIDVPTSGTRRLRAVADGVAAQADGDWDRTFDLTEVASRPEVQAAVADVRIDASTLDELAAFVIAAHITADDFITLHMVTGARALRTVVAHLAPSLAAALIAGAVPIMTVAYAAAGAPAILDDAELDELRHRDLPSRTEIAEQAARSSDAHVIKLANTALVEEARTGDLLYRLAAARVVDHRG
ncbi:MAG TPA: questin oxidase family protein [Acidimicrobiales bacterium]|nr:questin oxidase family protein [Acidimicrobiales bacterium]